MRELPLFIKTNAISVENNPINKITFFTHNPNKILLAQTVADLFNTEISIIENLSGPYVDFVERDGITYLDRALLKAKKGYEIRKLPCIGIDYGMEILSLNRKPGIETKHWMNSMSDEELLKTAINAVAKLPSSQRMCEFVGVGIMIIDDTYYLYARESDVGVLLTSPKGPIYSGHPLSSLLYLPEKKKTLAQLTPDEFSSKDIRIYNKLFCDFNNVMAQNYKKVGVHL